MTQWWTFLEQRGETEQWNEVGVPAVSRFLSWLRNGRTVELALVAPAESPSPETLAARLAAVISFYRWQEAVFGVPVARRLLRGAPRRAQGRGLLAHLDARSSPGPSSLVRVRRNRRRDRPPPLLPPPEIQAILDGCAVYDIALGEWVGNLRDRLLFALLAESGSLTESYQGGLLAEDRVKSYANLLTSKILAVAVIQRLGLRETPGDLSTRISVSIPAQTVLMDYSVTDRSPERARYIANAIGIEFPRLVNSLESAQGQSVAPLRVSVTQFAETPTTPASPRLRVNLALGLLGGLVLGLLGALVRDRLDGRVRDVSEATAAVGGPVLGLVEWRRPTAGPPLAHPDDVSPFAEAFRQIREKIWMAEPVRGKQIVVVTSAGRSEGRTTTAANLAIALARGGRRIVLVDADLSKPGLAALLESPAGGRTGDRAPRGEDAA